jgi:hypothetical protein
MAFKIIDFIRARSRSYGLVFGKGDRGAQRAVLHDLAKFCRAMETCFDPDPRIHAVLEGRREVWLRIANHLNLSPQELLAIYSPGTPFEKEQENA